MKLSRWHFSLALAALAALTGPLPAADLYSEKEPPKLPEVALPRAAEIASLDVLPKKVALKGSDDALQIILTANLTGNRLQDLTHDAKYEVADTKIARVTSTGRVIPLANGKTTVTVRFAEKALKVPVTCEYCDVDLPINFANQIVPIFTKLGCNSGGCHGKASGQNGFKLSLLGFYPDEDYEFLVKEARGRRLFPTSPAKSLLLAKPVGKSPHGGGKRME